MARPSYPFPEDEFDKAGTGRTPEGVHRLPRARWRILLPFVVVLLLAPTLAYLGFDYLESRSGSAAVPASSVSTGDDVVGRASADDATGGPVQESAQPTPPAETAPAEPGVSRDVRVVALNGTGTDGIGDHARSRLVADGFTTVVVDDSRSNVPRVSTVYYNNAGLAASAQQAAAVLKIGRVVEDPAAARSIAIVLRSDYQP